MEENATIIREYREGDEVRILRLFKEVFGLERTIDHWNWQFKKHPQGNGWVTLAEIGNKIVAQYCMMRNHLNFMGREIIAGQSCDTMVRSDQRGQKWFSRLATRNYKYASEKGAKAVFGFPDRNSYPGFMRDLEWHRIVSLKYYFYRIGFQKIWGQKIDRIFKYFYRILIKLKYYFSLLYQGSGVKIETLSHLPDDLEDMLREIRDYEVLCVWKDLKYLKWRYENHPDHNYLFHVISIQGRLQGLVITRDCGDTITICEVLHREKNEHQSILLLHHVVDHWATSSAQTIEFLGHDSGFFEAIFKNFGFQMSPYSNFVFGGRVFGDPALESKFISPYNWTIVYGDTDVV